MSATTRSRDDEGSAQSDRKGARYFVAGAAAVVAAAGAWLRPLWHDELYTLAVSRLPTADLIEALKIDSGPPLYYLLCHLLFVVLGWPEASVLGTVIVRLPSVCAFALMPMVVWRALPESGRTMLWGPVLAVVWLPALYFGTEARVYALLALVNAVLWIRGPEWIERGGRWLLFFALLAAALPMLHYAGVTSFVLLPALAFFIRRGLWPRLFGALAAAAAPLMAWLPVILGAPEESMSWVAAVSGPGRPGIASVGVVSPAGPFPVLFEAVASPVPAWISVSVLVLAVSASLFGAWKIFRKSQADAVQRATFARLALGLLPVVILGVSALAGVPVYFAGRTESMVWPLAAVLLAAGSAALPWKIRLAALAPYCCVGLITLGLWVHGLSSRPAAPGIRVGRELARELGENDLVVVAGLWQLEVEHGLAEARLGNDGNDSTHDRVRTIPPSQANHPGWLDRVAVMSPDLLVEARALEGEGRRGDHRIWLVWSPALPLEQNFFPAFSGWGRMRIVDSQVIVVDLLLVPQAL